MNGVNRMNFRPIPPKIITAASGLGQILELRGEDFIKCAYLTILKREADPEGLENYLRLLREGLPKSEILVALYSSSEANEIGGNIAWMRPVLRTHKFSYLPVIGKLVLNFSIKESKASLAKRLGALEEKIDYLERLQRTPISAWNSEQSKGDVQDVYLSETAAHVLREFCQALCRNRPSGDQR